MITWAFNVKSHRTPLMLQSSSSLSFGLFPIRGGHSRYVHFYYMAFVLRSDALPATNPLCGGKTGPPVFHIKVGASHYVPSPRTQNANLPACSPQPPLNAERQAEKLWIPFFKVFCDDSTRGMNPRSTDCEVDALTTTPLRFP